jgi:histone-lysine N-methyltransferase SETD3
MYYSDDYRGVHCLTKVPADEVILYVPLKHIMTSEVAKGSDIGKKIIQSGVELRSTHSYLAAYLLQEKHKKNKSFWEPYLRILPVHYANMPLSFDEEQLAWLKGSMCLQKIADRIDSLRREYENIRRHVPEFGRYTLDEFVWARLVVITRIFGLVIEGNKTDGLVPYADMLNHKKPREVAGIYTHHSHIISYSYLMIHMLCYV